MTTILAIAAAVAVSLLILAILLRAIACPDPDEFLDKPDDWGGQ
ncbi:hypothetical protein [Chelativorans sp.]|nr:hypothetical protein [Chelativorans sp.]